MKKYTHKTKEGALVRFVGSKMVTAQDDYLQEVTKVKKPLKKKKK